MLFFLHIISFWMLLGIRLPQARVIFFLIFVASAAEIIIRQKKYLWFGLVIAYDLLAGFYLIPMTLQILFFRALFNFKPKLFTHGKLPLSHVIISSNICLLLLEGRNVSFLIFIAGVYFLIRRLRLGF